VISRELHTRRGRRPVGQQPSHGSGERAEDRAILVFVEGARGVRGDAALSKHGEHGFGLGFVAGRVEHNDHVVLAHGHVEVEDLYAAVGKVFFAASSRVGLSFSFSVPAEVQRQREI
jgi:hypothetical protein